MWRPPAQLVIMTGYTVLHRTGYLTRMHVTPGRQHGAKVLRIGARLFSACPLSGFPTHSLDRFHGYTQPANHTHTHTHDGAWAPVLYIDNHAGSHKHTRTGCRDKCSPSTVNPGRAAYAQSPTEEATPARTKKNLTVS